MAAIRASTDTPKRSAMAVVVSPAATWYVAWALGVRNGSAYGQTGAGVWVNVGDGSGVAVVVGSAVALAVAVGGSGVGGAGDGVAVTVQASSPPIVMVAAATRNEIRIAGSMHCHKGRLDPRAQPRNPLKTPTATMPTAIRMLRSGARSARRPNQ